MEVAAGYAHRSGPDAVEGLRVRLKQYPRCPITRYLLACHEFDRGRPASSVQHLMIAHHAEPALESAALLAFAGLNWISRSEASLLTVLLDTWEEFRRPEFDRKRKERRLLDVFSEPMNGVEGMSPLARRLWRLPLRTLRIQLREAVLSQDTRLYGALLATA